MVPMDQCHIDPVYKTIWLNAKQGNEFFTGSTDGTVSIPKPHWDFRFSCLQQNSRDVARSKNLYRDQKDGRNNTLLLVLYNVLLILGSAYVFTNFMKHESTSFTKCSL